MKRVTIALLGVAAALAVGCGGVYRADTSLHMTVPWQGFQRVEVRIPNGHIEISSGGAEAVSITGEKSAAGASLSEAQQNLAQVELYAGETEQSGTLLIELRYPDALKAKSPAAHVVVQMPAPCPAKVTGSNGAIVVSGLEGGVSLATSNGSIQASDIKGPLSATTSNGRIEVATVTGDLSARSSNGEIVARDVNGACALTTSNGAIRLTGAPPAGSRVDLTTTNGAIRLTLPDELAAELKLRTSNGHVRVSLGDAQVSDVQADRNSYHALLNGGGGQIVATTSNGAITVEAR